MKQLLIYTFFLLSLNSYADNRFSFLDEEWVEVQSANFHIITDYNEKTALEIAQKLERFRYYIPAFTKIRHPDYSLPVKLFLFKKRYDFKQLTQTELAGYYFNGSKGSYGVADLDLYKKGTDTSVGNQTLFHEYTHHMFEYHKDRVFYPMWYEEGVAEYFSTFESTDNRMIFGRAAANNFNSYYYTQTDVRKRYLERMLKDNSNFRNERAWEYYNVAYIFIYYSNLNEKRKKQLDGFLNDLEKGFDVDKAWNNNYKISFRKMDDNLFEFVRKNKFSYKDIKLEKSFEHKKYLTTKLTPYQTQLAFADLLIQHGEEHYEGAERILMMAIKENAKDEAALIQLAKLYTIQGRNDDADMIIKKVKNKDSFDYLETKGIKLHALANKTKNPKEKGKFFSQARDYYRQAIKLDNLALQVYFHLGRLYSDWFEQDSSINPEEGILSLNEALYFVDIPHYQFRLARMYQLKGDTNKAYQHYAFSQKTKLNEDGNPIGKTKGDFFSDIALEYKKLNYPKEQYAYMLKAVDTEPENAILINDLAWLQITSKQENIFAPQKGLQGAIKAAELSKYEHAYLLDTLAAAHAINGNMEDAVKWQSLAISKLNDEQKDIKKEFKKRLKEYKEGIVNLTP
ncbi:DUF1570 domain-containing protein [Teredinibacter sp. KSP-S5-2]|uniref:DUF1570 domain-containing protein n=1 Tax=Teredinibacter sp. KSP-S5-2 TaxID=3034506 RepID=UPI0029347A79|nr:DUF1570 domain-containing protein [Teredinibacter sp. KSP-S5-2]WNO09671.1 DUF1570 domain-containing protein [Teredinibacter sp. KSP-S5-2]